MQRQEYAKAINYEPSLPTDTKRNGYKVSVKNLNSWFGSKQALKNINLDVKENTVTSLIGPSGWSAKQRLFDV